MKNRKWIKRIIVLISVICCVGICLIVTKNKNTTRIEWIHELSERFNKDFEMEEYGDYEFTDLDKDSKYYKDALWAKSLGLFEDESIEPNDDATRSFAAYTLNKCLGLQLAQDDAYTYLDVDKVAYPEYDQLAVKRGWFELDNGFFNEKTAITDEEVTTMLNDADQIVSLGIIDEKHENIYKYADGVKELPKDTLFQIANDEKSITFESDDTVIQKGDNFVVYNNSLPMAFIAKRVKYEGHKCVVNVEKADSDVFENVDEQGVIDLSAEGVEVLENNGIKLNSTTIVEGEMGSVDYSDGKISMSTSLGDSKAGAYLSNLKLNHSFSENGFTVSISGNWGFNSTLSYKEAIIDDVPLCKIRVLGVGVIKASLSMSQGMEMSGSMSGTFCAGVTVLNDGTIRAINEKTVNNSVVSGKGSIEAAFKVSAGVDIVAAAADIYGEVGLKTQYTSQVKENTQKQTVHCQDFKYYVFLAVGAEAKYYAFWTGKMQTLASKELRMDAENNNAPYIIQIHFEDGEKVSSCTMGMHVADLSFGGTTVNTGSTILNEERERKIETDVTLGYDVVVPADMTVTSNINLNGHALTVKGNLIQESGQMYLNVDSKLKVEGDYRIQKETDGEGEEKTYTESTGCIYMTDGEMEIDGDFVTESTKKYIWSTISDSSNVFDGGKIRLKGNLKQLKTVDTANAAVKDNLYISGAKVEFCGTEKQEIYFENPEDSYIKRPVFTNSNVEFPNGLHGWKLEQDEEIPGVRLIGDLNLNGHALTVKGNLIQESGQMYLNVDSKLKVEGDYRIQKETDGEGEEKTYTESTGCIYMTDGEMEIDGDFVTESTKKYIWSTISDSSNVFDGGKIRLKGNLKQLKTVDTANAAVKDNLYISGAKVEFCGTEKQEIYFENPEDSYIKRPVFTNSNVEFPNGLHGWGLTQNVTLDNSVKSTCGTFDLNGYSLTINGDLVQTSGTMNIHAGQLNVSGNYEIESETVDKNTGKVCKTNSLGVLLMTRATDMVNIGADFVMHSSTSHSGKLTAGTMYVGGNFSQKNGSEYGFCASGTHTVVLNGKAVQNVLFEGAYSKFNNLSLIGDKKTKYVFKPDNCWNNIYEEVKVTDVLINEINKGIYVGESIQLEAVVEGENNPPQDVIWKISNSTKSSITTKGLLTVSKEETERELIITATSVLDKKQYGETVIKILSEPVVVPTPTPITEPSAKPTVTPVTSPTTRPSAQPTIVPSAGPTAAPSTNPTTEPSARPTVAPSTSPTTRPSARPTAAPSTSPTTEPSAKPTVTPVTSPTPVPSARPTIPPSASPTIEPSIKPTAAPNTSSTTKPGAEPTIVPSAKATVSLSAAPSIKPSEKESIPNSAKVAKVNKIKLKNIKKKTVLVVIGKVNNAALYKIQYSTDKRFKKSVKSKKTSKLSCKLTKLKKGKTYWIRVCAVNGKIQGKWSKTRKIKVKK